MTKIKNGGGVALMVKSKYNLKLLKEGVNDVFEFGTWNLKIGDIKIIVLGVYHPPRGINSNHQDFIDQFTELIGDIE